MPSPLQRYDVTVSMSQQFRNNKCSVAAFGSHFRSDDLLGFGVCRNVEFTIGSTFVPSVFVKLLFALAVNHQPSAVDHNVKRTSRTAFFERNVRRFGMFAKGRIIENARFMNFEKRKQFRPNPMTLR